MSVDLKNLSEHVMKQMDGVTENPGVMDEGDWYVSDVVTIVEFTERDSDRSTIRVRSHGKNRPRLLGLLQIAHADAMAARAEAT